MCSGDAPEKVVRVEAEHGTDSGYQAHMDHRHPPCEPCRKAHAEASKAWYAKQKYTKAGNLKKGWTE